MHRLSYTGNCWLLPREGHSCVTAFRDFEILFRSVLHNPYFSKDNDSREGGLTPQFQEEIHSRKEATLESNKSLCDAHHCNLSGDSRALSFP